jgi:hypothetical protein
MPVRKQLVSQSFPFAEATVELVLRCDSASSRGAPRSVYPTSDDALTKLDSVYRQANNRCPRSTDLAIREGRFQTKLDVPAEAAGICNVCVVVAGRKEIAMGSARVEVVRLRRPGSI